MTTTVQNPIPRVEALAILKQCEFYFWNIDDGTLTYTSEFDRGNVMFWFCLEMVKDITSFSIKDGLSFDNVLNVEKEHHCCGFSIAFEDPSYEDGDVEVYEGSFEEFLQELKEHDGIAL